MRRLRLFEKGGTLIFILALGLGFERTSAQDYGVVPFTTPSSGTVAKFPFSYPNPFGMMLDCRGNIGGVCFAFESNVGGEVILEIFDMTGYRLRNITYASLATNNGVADVIHWDGTTQGGFQVANGVYFYRIKIKDSATGAKQTIKGRCYKFFYPP